jgi:hypothetical protein
MKPGEFRLSESYRQKQKHIDAHNILESFRAYPQIPESFDGRPASDPSGAERIRIGETYHFEGAGMDERDIGTVTAVTLLENERKLAIGVSTPAGQSHILKADVSDTEIQDIRKYGDAYFGLPEQKKHHTQDLRELYEWLVDSYRNASKETLLKLADGRPDIDRLRQLDRADLLLEVCEGMAATVDRLSKAKASAS